MWSFSLAQRTPHWSISRMRVGPSSQTSAASSSLHRPRPALRVSSRCKEGESGSSSPNATATVICAMIVAPPRPTWPLSTSSTEAPLRAAVIAAYMPAPPAPTIRTSEERWDMIGLVTHPLRWQRKLVPRALRVALFERVEGFLRGFLLGLFLTSALAFAQHLATDSDLRGKKFFVIRPAFGDHAISGRGMEKHLANLLQSRLVIVLAERLGCHVVSKITLDDGAGRFVATLVINPA